MARRRINFRRRIFARLRKSHVSTTGETRVNMYEIVDMERHAYRERRRLYGHINFLCKPAGWRARESDCKSAVYLLTDKLTVMYICGVK